MSKSTVEIDFFQVERQNAPSKPPSSSDRAGGVPPRGIQRLVSRINPQLLKTVMASGGAAGGRPLISSRPSSPTSLPVLNPAASGTTASQCTFPETAPLTIFYNGTVAAFDVPPDQAEVIIRMAEMGIVDNQGQQESSSLGRGGQLEGDLPIARRKSLQRFLEKRKERLSSASPYHEGTSHTC